MTNIVDDHGEFWWRNLDSKTKFVSSSNNSPIAGHLVVDGEGRCKLELHGVLSDVQTFMHRMTGDELSETENLAIQGQLKGSSEHVMLLGVYSDGGRVSFGGLSYEKYVADTCLIGNSEFVEGGEPKFESLYISFKGYEEWLNIDVINAKRTKRSLKISYKPPSDLTYNLQDNRKLSVRSFLSGPAYGSHSFSELSITNHVGVEIQQSQLESISSNLREYKSFCHFMILLTGSDYNLEWPTVSSKVRGSTKKSFKVYTYRRLGSLTKPDRHSAWLSFCDAKEDFGSMYESWRGCQKELGASIGLFFGARRHMGLYGENRFVNLIWGLESLHRAVFKVDENKDFRDKSERIMKQIFDVCSFNRSDRKFLQSRLGGRFEPILADRIRACIDDLDLPLNVKKLAIFCERCAEIRNVISHFGGRKPGATYPSLLSELIDKTEAVSVFYRAILMKRTGLTSPMLKKIFLHGRTSRQIRLVLDRAGLAFDIEMQKQ